MATKATATVEHHEEGGHHEAPAVVERRQRLGIWLFIAGDVVSLGALMFTYLYLRAVNTGGHWKSFVGFVIKGKTPAEIQNLIGNATPSLIHEPSLSLGFTWLITAVVVASAALFWADEAILRSGVARLRGLGLVGCGAVLAAAVLQVMQLRNIPEYWFSHNDANLGAYTTYGSAMLALGMALLIHLILIAFLGLGIQVRTARGVISADKWYQVRYVRLFWVWVAVSTVIISIMLTVFK